MDKRAQVAEKKRAAQAKEAAQVAKEEKKKKEDVGGTTPKAGKRHRKREKDLLEVLAQLQVCWTRTQIQVRKLKI